MPPAKPKPASGPPIETSRTADALPGPEVFEPLCAVFRRYLKGVGQKYTPERAQVLDVLLEFDEIFQADQLLERSKSKGYPVSKATLYRTIKLLQEAGIIQQVLFESEHAHYQLAYGRRPRDLVIRVDTHQVLQIEVPELVELREAICRRLGLKPQGHRFQIFATGSAGAR
ncbi:MAG: transcriptional repressor [Planctomycetes bacterium]|nr:transcriptional repressor [Planctomycetota bacterium]